MAWWWWWWCRWTCGAFLTKLFELLKLFGEIEVDNGEADDDDEFDDIELGEVVDAKNCEFDEFTAAKVAAVAAAATATTLRADKIFSVEWCGK